MPTKSNNIGGHGSKRPGAGRKPKGGAEKAANGNPGGRKFTVPDIPDMEGEQMPKPDEIHIPESEPCYKGRQHLIPDAHH